MAFKVLVYHDFPDDDKGLLRKNGVELKVCSNPCEAQMIKDIVDCDAVIVFEQPENGFNKKIIDAGKKLKLIARKGVGYETVDVKYAEESGIFVTNTPRINNISVAEATIMMMIGCNRNTQKIVERFRRERKDYPFFTSDPASRGIELYGKTLGLIGCGSIGQSVAFIAANGFQMKIIGYDPYLKEIPAYITLKGTMDEVLNESDFVSLHLPSTDSTRGSIGLEQFKKMKPTAYFINAARGNIVREKDLVQALREKIIAGAGIDVYEQEPIAESSYELFEFERVFMLPHCTAFTVEGEERARASIIKSLIEAASGKKPTYAVNNPKRPRLFEK
jgi:D-3-phosphoglycerate dehydrogenase